MLLQIAKLVQHFDGRVLHALLLEAIDQFGRLGDQIVGLLQQPAQLQSDPSLLLGLERARAA